MAEIPEKDPTLLCAMCTEDGALTCTGCRAIRYCSAVCQKQDWQLHKLLCKTWNEYCLPPVPGLLRGIYFSCNTSAPRFVWYDANLDDQNMVLLKYNTIGEIIQGMKTGAELRWNPIESFNRPLFKNDNNVKGSCFSSRVSTQRTSGLQPGIDIHSFENGYDTSTDILITAFYCPPPSSTVSKIPEQHTQSA